MDLPIVFCIKLFLLTWVEKDIWREVPLISCLVPIG